MDNNGEKSFCLCIFTLEIRKIILHLNEQFITAIKHNKLFHIKMEKIMLLYQMYIIYAYNYNSICLLK